MRGVSRIVWSGLLGVLALASGSLRPIAAQDPAPAIPVFRTGVEAVQIDAFVTDRRGNPVSDLTAADFEITENGRRQAVATFSHVDIPLVRPGDGAGPPEVADTTTLADVQQNGQEHGRIYVLVLGDVSWQGALRGLQHLERFLDHHFGETDLAAVVSLERGGAVRFTRDRSLLLQTAGFLFAGRDEDGEIPEALSGYRDRGREQARMFGLIAEALAAVPARRKAILLISETFGFDAFDVIDNPRSSFSRDAREALDPVTRGNITIYTLHPGGAVSPFLLRPGSGARGTSRGGGRLRLNSIAHVTGGFAIGSDVNKAFERIVRENSSYYVLGYYPTERPRRGGYRRVDVRVTRPGLSVRSRDGYFVADPGAPPRREFVPPVTISAAITGALASPVPLNTVPLRVFAAPYRGGDAAAVALVIELDAAALDLEERDGTLRGLVDVTAIGVSGTTTFPGTRHSGELSIPGGRHGDRVPLRILSEIRLPPGRYQLRAAAGVRDGRTGSVLADLEVPDFDRDPLMLSGVAIASMAAADVATLEARDTIGDRLPVPATTAREFDRGDTLVVFAEIYENLWNQDEHTIALTTSLRSGDGRVIPMTHEARSSRTPAGEHGGHAFVARIPLDAVPPGPYVLHVEATADIGSRMPVAREVPLRVR